MSPIVLDKTGVGVLESQSLGRLWQVWSAKYSIKVELASQKVRSSHYSSNKFWMRLDGNGGPQHVWCGD